MNYLVLQDSADFGITQYDVFRVTSNPAVYQSTVNPDIEFGLSTLLEFPLFFQPVEILEATDKMQALADRINGATWTPAVGDYFTDIDGTLRLYRITGNTAPNFQYITISGGTVEEGEASQASFDDDRVPIIFDESGSGS